MILHSGSDILDKCAPPPPWSNCKLVHIVVWLKLDNAPSLLFSEHAWKKNYIMGFTYLLKTETYAQFLLSVVFSFFPSNGISMPESGSIYISVMTPAHLFWQTNPAKKWKEFLEETSFFNDALDSYMENWGLLTQNQIQYEIWMYNYFRQ